MTKGTGRVEQRQKEAEVYEEAWKLVNQMVDQWCDVQIREGIAQSLTRMVMKVWEGPMEKKGGSPPDPRKKGGSEEMQRWPEFRGWLCTVCGMQFGRRPMMYSCPREDCPVQ